MKDGITNINKPMGITVPVITDNQLVSIFMNGVGYAVICFVTTALITLIFSVVIIPGITSIGSAIAPAVCSVFLGIFFIFFLFLKSTGLKKSNTTNNGMYAFIVFVSSMLIGFVKGHDSVITNLFYSGLFVLPYIIYRAWLFYNQLSFINYRKTWYSPQQACDIPKVTIFLNSLFVQIRIAPRYSAPEKVYEATVPGKLSVGVMFTNFIKNKNGENEQKEALEDISSQLFGWQFFCFFFFRGR